MTVIQRSIFGFLLWFLLMIGIAIGLDYLLHLWGYVSIGRYLGTAGLVAILLSLLPYSLRKHRIVHMGNPATFLRLHQSISWIGGILVIVHAGIHMNALLPWLALTAMLATIASGLVSVFLLRQTRKQLDIDKSSRLAQGQTLADVDEQLYFDALAVGLLGNWRLVHLLTTAAFSILTLSHITSILLFGRWF